MDNETILKHVDHTLLKQDATWSQIEQICKDALKYHTASVCIPASYVKEVHNAFPTLNVCTCIGFPNGYNTTAVKTFEVSKAIEDGANEVDMVINVGWAKDHKYDLITNEIASLKKAAGNKILKVIIETCFLTDEEKTSLCKCVTDGKADYIKTSTGFGPKGATLEDVKLFKKYIGPGVKIKAAGGIRTKEDMEAYLEAGCDRIGCSAAIKVLGE